MQNYGRFSEGPKWAFKALLKHSHSLTLDMLNNFCLHVYRHSIDAQNSVFIAENFRGHRAGSQLKSHFPYSMIVMWVGRL